MDEQTPQSSQDSSLEGDTFQSSPPSTPSVDTPKIESAKNRYLIATVLILVAVGLGSWVWRNQIPKLYPTPTPTIDQQPAGSSSVPIPDTTADWQTYRNEEYGFEFKYPNDWQSTEFLDLGWTEFGVSFDPNKINLGSEYLGKVMFQVQKNPPNLSDYNNGDYLVEDILISDKKAVKVTPRKAPKQDFRDPYTTIFVFSELDDGQPFMLALDNSLIESDKKIFEQILSTFKFIK